MQNATLMTRCAVCLAAAGATRSEVAKSRRIKRKVLVLSGLLWLLGLAAARPGQAADFLCPGGDVACLIDAITAANANGEVNTITLAAGTYSLTAADNTTDGPNGLPSVTSVLTIRGTGANTTIIERDANGPQFRLVHVAATGTLTLRNLALQGGFGPLSEGGGLFNRGTTTILQCTIAANAAIGVRGGGISNRGTLTVTDSTITRNRTTSDNGGGIANAGTLIITNTIVTDNFSGFVSGGVDSVSGVVTIIHSTLARNSAVFAGAIENHPGSTLTITNSTLFGNSTEGDGAGVYNNGTLTMLNTTLADNSATSFGRGGGLWNNVGRATLINCTLAGNNSAAAGGGIWNGAQDGGTVALQNTILALNTGSGPDCFGPVISQDNNLVGDPTSCGITLQPNDLTGDPGLGGFTDDGTPGNGHFPLLAISPAIDAGNDAACPLTDQLGQPRVGRCDIGAIEFSSPNRCPLGQGFWKNHPTSWSVISLTLGDQEYTQEELLALLHTPPRGDASLILAHQLIAAKLNLANGSNPTPIGGTITEADGLLSGFEAKLPYHIRPSTATGRAMVSDASILERYNHGQLTPDCAP